jgi:hypothetical protein
LSIFDFATFGAARAELSLLKFCRVATNVALNLFSANVEKRTYKTTLFFVFSANFVNLLFKTARLTHKK